MNMHYLMLYNMHSAYELPELRATDAKGAPNEPVI